MTEPGRLPDGGAQEQAGGVPGQVGQPVMPPAPFPFPGHPDEAAEAVAPEDEEDEDLLMPGAIGAWGDAAAAPRPVTQAVPRPAAPVPSATPTEPEYLDLANAANAAAAPPGAPGADAVPDAPADAPEQPVAPEWQQPAEAPAAAPAESVPPAAPAARPAEQPPPVEAAPVQPAPVQPAPVEEAPVEPAPVEETPVADVPVQAAPVQAAPVQAAPVQAAPVQAEPVQPAPVQAAPAEAEPVQAAPVPDAPVQEAPLPDAPVPDAPVPGEPGQPTAVPQAAVPAPEALAPEAPAAAPAADPVVARPAPEAVATEAPVTAPTVAEASAAEQPVAEAPLTDRPAPAEEPAAPQPAVPTPAGQDAPAHQAVAPAPEAAAPPVQQPIVLPAPQPEQAAPEQAAPEQAAPAQPPAVPVPVHVPGPRAPEPAPPAPGYSQPEREAVHRLMRERRDMPDGFRPDPIPNDVLLRVLEAAHTAPSAGIAQPWDFVIIRSAETRQAVHTLAGQQRDAYAKSLPKARAKQFKELGVDAILDTPVNIVVTADPTRGGSHASGRGVQPQLAPHSAALAVENLWLAARAEGLGVGWVGFFDERELVRALDLPGHLEIVAYLCVGYVDAFPGDDGGTPEAPGRRPLSWVVHEEAYGRRALPGAEPHDLLSETLAEIRPLDAQALGEAWERQKRMTKPAGALGALEIISAQLCGLSRSCPPPVPEPAAVAVFAGDHGVHAQGVTPWPQEVTTQMVANFLGGGAVCNAFASQVGAEVCVVDVGVRGELPPGAGLMPRRVRAGTGDISAGPAMTREEALRAVEVGIETARDLVAAGNRALLTGEMGIANTTVSAALVAAFTGADPAEVTGRGTGIDDETHARKVDVVRRALQLHQPDPSDPIGTLAAVGGLEHAALTGFVLGGASLRVPVILDGVTAGAAALAARVISPEAVSVCIAGHRSAEPGHLAALTALGLRPLVDLDLRLGEGTGALLALPVVQSAARAMREVATFDSAGVTDKN